MSLNIFISYGHDDLEIATGVKGGLEARGMRAFLANGDVSPGESFRSVIKREIRRADVVLLLWSAGSGSSTYVGSEIGWANEYGTPVIPILLHEGLPHPPIVGDIRHIKAWDVSDITDLIEDLEKRKAKKTLKNLAVLAGIALLAVMIVRNLIEPPALQSSDDGAVEAPGSSDK